MKHRSTDIPCALESRLDRLLTLPRPLYGHALALPNRAIERRHRHPWAQLSYAIRGVVEVTTAHARFMAPPLRAVWIPPGQAHGVRCSADTVIRSLYIDASVDPRGSSTCRVLEVGDLLRELIRAFSAMPIHYDERGAEGRLAAVLLDQLALAPEAGLVLPWPQDTRLREVCHALQSHPRNTRTLASYSRALGVSDKTLSRLFRQQTGLSFRLWRQRSRLFSALPLLERGDRVTDVAQACGYESMSAFIAAFRDYMGVTPGEFLSADATGTGHARPGPPL
jgi:AraC-like DNA-binding protein